MLTEDIKSLICKSAVKHRVCHKKQVFGRYNRKCPQRIQCGCRGRQDQMGHMLLTQFGAHSFYWICLKYYFYNSYF